jgi:hemerythrin-like domain-containing protein
LKAHHPKTPQWAIESLDQVWKEHTVHVTGHHVNEDEITTPAMKTRIHLPDKLESDHEIVLQKVQAVTHGIHSLQELDPVTSVEQALLDYKDVLFPHLLEEEEIALPLVRSYFSPEDWAPIQQEIVTKAKPIELGSFIYYQTEENFREKFMKQKGIPFFVWHLVFRNKYQYFLDNVKAHLDALEAGVPVLPPEKKTLFC